jgi:hypothetical protein
MRLWQRDDVQVDPGPEVCEHSWRLRNVSFALPGLYVFDVCDLCDALHLDGPEAITGPPSHVADGATMYLESLARRWSPPSD